MENTAPPLGPRPAPATATVPASRAQREVLDVLLAEGGPTPLTRLSAVTGLHENTLRGHLDALGRAGLVDRERATPAGRGRPAWLWRAAAASPGSGEYAGLAGALARTLSRTSADPAADAVEAGRSWGRELAAEQSRGGRAVPAEPRARVGDLLDGLGFAPKPDPRDADGTTLRLTRCPLLDVARELPEVVCNVHLGLVGGALESYAEAGVPARDVDTALVPFAEPGACLLHLRDAARTPGRDTDRDGAR